MRFFTHLIIHDTISLQFSSENSGDISSEVSSQKTRHLSTISYSLSQSDSAPSTPSLPMEYCPTSTIEIQSSCYPSIEEQYYVSIKNCGFIGLKILNYIV